MMAEVEAQCVPSASTAATVVVRFAPWPPHWVGRNSPANLCSTSASMVSQG
ncbi:Uncharacterised protein [Bordetella pertussis]|nr:Uncharacterised protein [Bordetella pertussis]CFO05670.1 Uncharacterised protein [Bordetella pertussis]CFW61750.1 Uncharacterised protein [Bordetella pertussis]CPJ86509.1 Uncharacterised protein [Bordetella pertussis]CPO87530.1 Uncharacterised protein [Bordetella pertussis]